MIINQLDSITPKLVEFALDGLSMRHKAIASNIANSNSSNYKPISVSFENQISDLRNSFYNKSVNNAHLNFQPVVSYVKKQNGSSENIGIDISTVQLSQNVLQYHALIKGMSQYISTLSIAIKEGRN